MKKYVLGFLFTSDLKKVVLIVKNKPEWQAGLLNGVGGKIEDGETPDEAMTREFLEEAGIEVTAWNQFFIMKGDDWEVNCFRSFVPTRTFEGIKTMTDESIFIANVSHIEHLKTITNLTWLIPMCLDMNDNFTGEVVYSNN